MSIGNPYDHAALKKQIERQKKYAWDLDKDIEWGLGIQPDRFFIPLDEDSLIFPGASEEQRVALSQLMGLIVNSTIAEMETVINNLRDVAWASILRSYSVNPEMWQLGELFFEEESKHALAFYRFNQLFCSSVGMDPEDMDRIIPKVFGSVFLKAVIANAKSGGHMFWWLTASTEEVALEFFDQIHKHKTDLDPLFYEVHKKHMEEETRHHNYAFLMLQLIQDRSGSLTRFLHKKTDLVLGQIFSTGWMLSELHKIFEVKKLKRRHAFFEVIASVLPLFGNLSKVELVRRLFVKTPYISLLLNLKNHPLTYKLAKKQRVPSIPLPNPNTKAFVGRY